MLYNAGHVSTLEQVLVSPDSVFAAAQSTHSQVCTAGCPSKKKLGHGTLFRKAHKGLVSLEGMLRTLREKKLFCAWRHTCHLSNRYSSLEAPYVT